MNPPSLIRPQFCGLDALLLRNRSRIPFLSFITARARSWWFRGFLALVILPLSGIAAKGDIAKRLDELLSGSCQAGAPGFSVAVIEHGKPVYEKGYGLANLEYDIPVMPRTIYHIASVSKQFTAMAVVLLEKDG